MNNLNKYRHLVAWARARYTVNHAVVVSIGGKPSIYSRIENAAFEKYMRLDRDSVASLIFNPID